MQRRRGAIPQQSFHIAGGQSENFKDAGNSLEVCK